RRRECRGHVLDGLAPALVSDRNACSDEREPSRGDQNQSAHQHPPVLSAMASLLRDARTAVNLPWSRKAFVRSSLKLRAIAEVPGRLDGAVGGGVAEPLDQSLPGLDP